MREGGFFCVLCSATRASSLTNAVLQVIDMLHSQLECPLNHLDSEREVRDCIRQQKASTENGAVLPGQMPELISPLDLYQFADRCRCPVVSLTDEVLLGWGVHLLPSRPFVSTYTFRGTFLTQVVECKFANDRTC
jgi:hypothetical protein